MTTSTPLQTQHFNVADLHAYHRNPRQGNVEKIAESLKENGQYRAIVVNAGLLTGRPMEVLAGNHTLLAAQQLGWTQIIGHLINVSEESARRIVLADNRTSDLATHDDQRLLELLQEGPLEGTGYDQSDLDALASLLRDHEWENEDAQDALDDADETAWPTIRITCNPKTYDRFQQVPGEDEVARLMMLLERTGY